MGWRDKNKDKTDKPKKEKPVKVKKDKKGKNKNADLESTTTWEIEDTTTGTEATATDVSPTPTDVEGTDIEDVVDVKEQNSADGLDERNETEKELFQLMKAGNKMGMKELLRSNRSKIDINKKDGDGVDILTRAIEDGNEKMVDLILKIDPANIDTSEALLGAIQANNMKLLLKLLDFQDSKPQEPSVAASQSELTPKKKKWFGKKKGLIESGSNKYGSVITPFGMAAACGHYEIMQVLYNRGERIPELHMPNCKCSVCRSQTRDLEITNARITTLKAKANPAYMIFMAGQDGSFDPIHECFELTDTLGKCIELEPEFGQAYTDILEGVQKFPVDLLSMCRSMEETKTFLKPREGYVGPDVPYPRLSYAIQKKQVAFVAHSNAQYLMELEWTGEHWNPKTFYEEMQKHLVTLLIIVLSPIIQFFLYFATFCCKSVGPIKRLLSPVNRFRSKLGAYLWFCACLFFMAIEERAEADIQPQTEYVRLIVGAFVFSFTISTIRLYLFDPGRFWKRKWNIYDLVMLVLFWIAIVFWLMCFLRPKPQQLRKMLPETDPLLLGEVFFSLATVMAISRLLKAFAIHPLLGPLQISMGRMIYGFKSYIIFFAIVYLTFYLPIQMLVRPYKNVVEIKDGKELKQKVDILSVGDSIKAMHFEGFKSADMEIRTPSKIYSVKGKVERVENPQETTQTFLHIICAAYIILSSFLGGTLSGLMANAKESVEDAKTNEFKYIRCQEWLYHIQDNYLAPPYNVLPNSFGCSFFWSWCMPSKGGQDAGCDLEQCCYVRDVESPTEMRVNRRKYPHLLRRLFQRYFQHNRSSAEATPAASSDVAKLIKGAKAIKELIGDAKQDKPRHSGETKPPLITHKSLPPGLPRNLSPAAPIPPPPPVHSPAPAPAPAPAHSATEAIVYVHPRPTGNLSP